MKRFRLKIPFLTRIDLYLIGKFLGTYFFSILLIISIAVVFDYNDNIDKFTKNNAQLYDIIFVYYLNFILSPYLPAFFCQTNTSTSAQSQLPVSSGKISMRPHLP